MVVISCHLLGAPIYFGVDERVQDLYVVWDQLRRKKKKRTQIGRSEVGQELSWAWLKGWEVNLAAFPPHFANVSSQDQAASAPTPPPSPFKKSLLQRFFCSVSLPPLSKSTSPNTPSLPVEHADPKPNFLSPGHFLLCNTQSQVCFSRGVGTGRGGIVLEGNEDHVSVSSWPVNQRPSEAQGVVWKGTGDAGGLTLFNHH